MSNSKGNGKSGDYAKNRDRPYKVFKKVVHPMFKDFALTVTLKPALYMLTHQEQYTIFTSEVLVALSKAVIFERTSVTLELTKKGNIHLHGYIQSSAEYSIKTIRHQLDILFYGSGLYPLVSCIGGYYLTPAPDVNGWLRYMNKDPYYVEKYGILGWSIPIEDEIALNK